MPKKLKDEECCADWKMKKMKMGAGLIILGLILYAREIGIIPYMGSIWTLAMMLVGIAMVVKGLMK